MMGLWDVLPWDFDKNEETHADSINLTILKNVLLTVQPEFKITVRRILESTYDG